MSHPIRPIAGLESIKPYIGGDITPQQYTRKVGLSSNENPLGPSPMVIQKIQELAPQVYKYPSGASKKLRDAIGDFHKLDPEKIVCTNGSEEGITLLIRAFSGPGDEVLFSQYAFLLYEIAAKSVGAKAVKAPAFDLQTNVDSLLACVSKDTKIVVIDNPSNPIGSYLSKREVRRLRENLPEHVLLILDSAYAEYMDISDYTAGIDLVGEFENTIMTRTFSKFYGLAGLRLGWMYVPSYICDLVNRIRGPFCCNILAQEAGVIALQDVNHQKDVFNLNITILPWFMKKLEEMGLKFTPSVTNFILVEFPKSGNHTMDIAYDALARKGYIVRPVKNYGLMNHLRITMGLQEDMNEVVNILHTFLKQNTLQYDIK